MAIMESSGYPLSVGQFDEKGILTYKANIVNPFTYTDFGITAEPKNDLDRKPATLISWNCCIYKSAIWKVKQKRGKIYMKMNYNKKNIKMQKKYSHLMPLLLVPSIAIALIIVAAYGTYTPVVVIQDAAPQSPSSQLPQQQQPQQAADQNTNISLATSSEAAKKILIQKSGINSTEVPKCV